MEQQLIDELEDTVLDEAGESVAEDWRENVESNIENADQGADGLMPYLSTGVSEDTSRSGESGTYTFHIRHPTAPLHETGGHIEPQYARAKVMGWTRDEYYEALTDCNEWVKEKRLVRSAGLSLRRQY